MNDMLWKEIKQKHINTHLKPEKVEKEWKEETEQIQ